MSTMIKRGDILRATNGPHKGDYYLFARTCAGPDTNVVGQPIDGTKNYAYNLFNLSNGKARQTESHKILVSWRDGVNFTVGLPLIESHFGMTFELATDMVTVGPKITEDPSEAGSSGLRRQPSPARLPPMKLTGAKTATMEKLMAMTVRPISLAASMLA